MDEAFTTADVPEQRAGSQGDDKRTQSERAFLALRKQILSGALPAGEKLKIEVLQRDFALSSTPLREALHRLTVEGLVISEENRGFRAAPLSARDLRDITRLRVLIEGDALDDSIRCGDTAWEGRVVAAHYSFEKRDHQMALGDEAPDETWTQLHKAFHMSLVSGCSYPRLVASCSSLFDQSERYRRLSASVRTVVRSIDDEHRRLMDAVLHRRPEEARRLLIEHIEQTATNVINVLAASPGHTARPGSARSRTTTTPL